MQSAKGYPIILYRTTWQLCIFKRVFILVLCTAVKLVWCLCSKQRQLTGMNKLWRSIVTLKFNTISSMKFMQKIKESRIWHGAYFKSAKTQRVDTSFEVNAIKKSLLLLWTAICESPTKQWMETLPQPCSTILIADTPMYIQACWRWKKPILQALVKEVRLENYSKRRKHQLPHKRSCERSHIWENFTTLSHTSSYKLRKIFFFYVHNHTLLSPFLKEPHSKDWLETWTGTLLWYQ